MSQYEVIKLAYDALTYSLSACAGFAIVCFVFWFAVDVTRANITKKRF